MAKKKTKPAESGTHIAPDGVERRIGEETQADTAVRKRLENREAENQRVVEGRSLPSSLG